MIRAQFDTRRQTLTAGAGVWVALREELPMQPEEMSPPDKAFKLQPFLQQSEYDLALVDPLTITLQGRAFRPLAPLNLRVYPTVAEICT